MIEISQIALRVPNSDRSPLYDVINPASGSLKDLRMRSDVLADDIVRLTQFGAAILGQQLASSSRSSRQPLRLRPSGSGVTALLASRVKAGGARRDRTDDLMLAKHALSQLSYGPVLEDEMHNRASSPRIVVAHCCDANRRARLRQRYGAAAFVQEGLPSRSCRAAKAGGPGKT
jgi:hypothetical protein